MICTPNQYTARIRIPQAFYTKSAKNFGQPAENMDCLHLKKRGTVAIGPIM
jgi:hypothetical protein